MRVGFPGGPRLEWYDRNPQHTLESYLGSGVVPHGLTQRWTYTVPSGKKAFIETVTGFLLRATAATTELPANVFVEITPSGGSAAYILVCFVVTNNPGDKDRADIGQGPILLAGDNIKGYTQDLSTDGTFYYHVAAKITELDA